MTLVELIGLFHEYRLQAFPVTRPARYLPQTNRQTYEPQTPLIPWYHDPESGGRCPPMDQRKPGGKYVDG